MKVEEQQYPDDVRRALRSEKVTDRTRGKIACENLIRSDRSRLRAKAKEWVEIIRAAIDFEVKEVDYSQKKRVKSPSIDSVLLLKKIVRHCAAILALTPKICGELVRHSLEMIYDDSEPALLPRHREEHKLILVELLDPNISHKIGSENMYDMFVFIQRDAFIDEKRCSDPVNLRLLRAYCRALYLDSHLEISFLSQLLEWMCGSLFDMLIVMDQGAQFTISLVIADSLCSLMENNGKNHMEVFLGHMKRPISDFVRHFGTRAHRDSQIDSFLAVFSTYLSTFVEVGSDGACRFPNREWDPLFGSLETICVVLSDANALRGLVAGASPTGPMPTGASFFNILEDSRVARYLNVAAKFFCLQHRAYQITPLAEDLPNTVESSQNLKKSMLEQLLSDTEASWISFYESKSSVIDLNARRGLMHIRKQEKLLMEGRLLLISQILNVGARFGLWRENPVNREGALFLKHFERVHGLLTKYAVSSSLHSSDVQLFGAAVTAIIGSFGFCEQIVSEHNSMPSFKDDLRNQWVAGVVAQLLGAPSIIRQLQTNRRQSVSEVLFDFLVKLMETDLVLDRPHKWQVCQLALNVLPLSDPRSSGSSRFFDLLKRIIISFPEDNLPQISKSYLKEMQSSDWFQNPLDEDDFAAMTVGTPYRPSTFSQFLQCCPLFIGNNRVMFMLVCWLEYQYHSHAHIANCSVDDVSVYCTSMASLVCAIYAVDESGGPQPVRARLKPSTPSLLHEMDFLCSLPPQLPISGRGIGISSPNSTLKCSLQCQNIVVETLVMLKENSLEKLEREGEVSEPTQSHFVILLLISFMSAVYKVWGKELVLVDLVDLLKRFIQNIRSRVHSIRLSSVHAIFCHLTGQLETIMPLIQKCIHNVPSIKTNIPVLMSEILLTIEMIRDEALSIATNDEHCREVDIDDSSRELDPQRNKDSVSPRPLPSIKRPSTVAFDDDDDFMEGSSPMKSQKISSNRVPDSESIPFRLTFGAEQQRVILALIRCLAVLDQSGEQLSKAFDTLTRKTSGASTTVIISTSELYLSCAEAIIESSPSIGIQNFVIRTYWDSEYGVKGYLRTLIILYHLLSKCEAWTESTESFLPTCKEIMFAKSESLLNFPSQSWAVRCAQLDCVAGLIKRAENLTPEERNDIKEIFIGAVADADIRVRFAAARHLPLIFRLFPRHSKVYSAFLDAGSLFLQSPPASSISVDSTDSPLGTLSSSSSQKSSNGKLQKENWKIICLGSALTQMGRVSDAVVKSALSDLCVLFASQMAAGEVEYFDVRYWLRTEVDVIALAHGYRSSVDLISDVLPFLLEKWLTDPAKLELRKFPIYLRANDKDNDSSAIWWELGNHIIPIIAQIDDPKIRWNRLLEYAALLQLGSSDGDLAFVVRSWLPAIFANEKYFHQFTDSNDKSKRLREFVERCLSQNDVARSKTYISNAVYQAFMISTYFSSFHGNRQLSLQEQFDDSSRVIRNMVESLIDEAGVACGLFQACNIPEVLTGLIIRIQESSSTHSIIIRALAGCVTLSDVMATIQRVDLTVCHAMLRLVWIAFNRLPESLKFVAQVIEHICQCFNKNLPRIFNTRSKRSSLVPMEYLNLANDILAVSITLEFAILQSLTVCENCEMQDDYVLRCAVDYREVAASFTRLASSTEKPHRELPEHLENSLSSIHKSVRNLLSTRSILFSGKLSGSCLRCPEHIKKVLSNDLKSLLDLEIECSLLEMVAHLGNVLVSHLTGQPILELQIWYQLRTLKDAIDSATLIFSPKTFWSENGMLASQFLFALAEFSNRTQLHCFRELSTFFLGRFGAPDIHTVEQRFFPMQAGDLLYESKGNVRNLHGRILCRLHALVASEATLRRPAIAALASLCTHDSYVNYMLSNDSAFSSHILLKEILHFSSKSGAPVEIHSQYPKRQVDWKSESIWDPVGKEHCSWLCKLITCVTNELLGEAKSNSRGSTQGKSKPSKQLSPNLLLLSSLREIVKDDVTLAEAALPLILWEFLSQEEDSCSEFRSQVSSMINDRILKCPSAPEKAVRLICKCLTFICQQDLQRFLGVTHSRTNDRGSPVLFAERRSFNPDWPLPYSCQLDINTQAWFDSAMRCGMSCTALNILEIWMSSARPPSTEERRALLLKVYSSGHDPDALAGLTQFGTDLQAQTAQYASAGLWMEALSSHESIIASSLSSQRSRNVSDGTVASSVVGMARSLKLLGCKNLLSTWSQSVARMNMDQRSVAALRDLMFDTTVDSSMAISRDFGCEAVEMLQKWSDFGSGSSSCSRRHHQEFPEFWSHNISCALDELLTDTSSTAELRLSYCNVLIYPSFIASLQKESAAALLAAMSKTQQIVEVRECGQVLKDNSPSSQIVSEIVDRWDERPSSNSVVGLSPQSMAIYDLRLSMITRLIASRKLSPGQQMEFVEKIRNMTHDKSSAHALSPLIYKLRSAVMENISMNDSLAENKLESLLTSALWDFQDSQLLWRKGLIDAALEVLDNRVIKLLKICKDECIAKDRKLLSRCRNLLSDALRTRGEWTISSRAALGTVITSEYLLPANSEASERKQLILSHKALAEFYSRAHNAAKRKVLGKEWEHWKRVSEDRQLEFERCRLILQKEKGKQKDWTDETKALYRHYQTLRREIDLDERERKGVEESVSSFRENAIRNLVDALKLSEEEDREMILQLTNLWLSNWQHEAINSILEIELPQIPTFKFVPVTYQIFSRLDANTVEGDLKRSATKFQKILRRFVERVCEEHPHHGFPHLYSLANTVQANAKAVTLSGRSDAARLLIQHLRSHSNSEEKLKSCELFETYIHLFDSYVALANASIVDLLQAGRVKNVAFHELSMPRPFDQCLAGRRELPCVVTRSLPVNRDGDYSHIVRAIGYSPNFDVTDSGLSRPKIIDCLGSDGGSYRQLVKGGDDTRQDAVMQQVFEFVNYLLMKKPETRSRRLSIRTYKIVPTTPQTGILQWVDNTVAFGHYLCSKDIGAHFRYFPNEWPHLHCRDYMKNSSPEDPQDRFKRLQVIYQNFSPAFRFFFLERFSHPPEWVSRRMTYTRSVAVSSMVGYVLGIGDRHTHNILVDELTAEIVHIDFGIVFDQGKGLGTPETVPFRLTRDIVDGMGVTGCEGAFRKSCEESLLVLRENASALLTILEVVIYDPLYKWSLSPAQARKKQKPNVEGVLAQLQLPEVSEQDNGTTRGGQFGKDSAERALNRIKAKLQGFEDQTGDALSVPGHVDCLINEARALENLCKLFPGWAPWL